MMYAVASPEDKKSSRKRLRVRVDDKNRLDGKEMLAGLLIGSC